MIAPLSTTELIQSHRQTFDALLGDARRELELGNLEAAAVYADVADEYASWSGHCGFFANDELEEVLIGIGRRLGGGHARPPRSSTPKRVLHVVWGVWAVGGHSRFIWRWVREDKTRQHSVALTRMPVKAAPEMLFEATEATGGKVYGLTKTGMTARAAELRALASNFDLVVLHTVYDGATCVMAFADPATSPPVVYMNHADERHWSGVRICSVIANTRNSGLRLAIRRRGVATDRTAVLPVPVDMPQRRFSRSEAKQRLGIPEDSVVLVSIARAAKYRPSDGSGFVQDHAALLRADKRMYLIVVGPGGKTPESAIPAEFAGRARVVPETMETAQYYEAADIYVDSAPFVSNTSLLEAGSYGTPLVTRYPFPSADCEVLAADMPALDGELLQVTRSLDEYTALLLKLADDAPTRERLGAAARDRIERLHTGKGWLQSVEAVYSAACRDERPIVTSIPVDKAMGELDLVLERTVPFDRKGVAELITARLKYMDWPTRLRFWSSLVRQGELGGTWHVNMMIPDRARILATKVKRRLNRHMANFRFKTNQQSR